MSSCFPNGTEAKSYLLTKPDNCINGDFIIQQFGNAIGDEGYKLQADHSIAKPVRKRNKKRISGNIVDGQLRSIDGDEFKTTSLENLEGTKIVNLSAYPTLRKYSHSEQILGKGSSSNSYAAVVSGRNSRDGDMATFFVFSMSQVAEAEEFIPSFSSSATSIEVCNTCNTMSSSRSSVLTRDASVQVNLPINTHVSTKLSKSRSQGTMTSKKGQYKNKFVSVKTCCKETGELTTGQPTVPPVQFLGECFTFENALAKTVDLLGIKFVDWNDDDNIQIHPK